MDDGRRVKVILFEMGTKLNMKAYYMAPNIYVPYRFGDANLYWRDDRDPNGYGPFVTLHHLMNHYQSTIQARQEQDAKPKLLLINPANKVLIVDFKNKKKIISYEA